MRYSLESWSKPVSQWVHVAVAVTAPESTTGVAVEPVAALTVATESP